MGHWSNPPIFPRHRHDPFHATQNLKMVDGNNTNNGHNGVNGRTEIIPESPMPMKGKRGKSNEQPSVGYLSPSSSLRYEAGFVQWFSLVLAVFLAVMAVLHLRYLFEAFQAKTTLIHKLREARKGGYGPTGQTLSGHDSLLWCLLYSFGEAHQDAKVSVSSFR